MRAAVFTEFGPADVLQLREVAKPKLKDHDVLIRVYATSVNFGDTLVRNFASISPRKFHMPWLFWLIGKLAFGFRKPRINILGSEFAGEVETVGRLVTQFKQGDQVFGYCGPRMGAYAEYLRIPESGVLSIKPACMTYEQTAASPYGALMALGLLKKINLRRGQNILVVGASGGIGPAIVQLAKLHYGASVTGVCSGARMEYVKSLGADSVIDYTKEDFINRTQTYDYIIDILGKNNYSRCRSILKPRGRLIFVSFKMKQILQMLWTFFSNDRRVICSLVKETQKDLIFARELMEDGKIQSIVDRVFPLEKAAEAHRYAESKEKKGNIVISLTPLSANR